MPEIEIKRGYEVLPDNNIRFGIRVINNSDFAISDVEVILDYHESLFELEGSKIQKLGTIPPTVPRTAKFILKPLGCIHKEEIGATILYKDHQWKKHAEEMRPKEVHCVCPFLKEKVITQAEFFNLSKAGYSAVKGVNFENIDVDPLASFLSQMCQNRIYKVSEYNIDNGKIVYLASESVGEKAYYLLTAVIKEYEGLTQIMLRANSDKPHGLNGFLNEIMDNLRHVVETVQSAREIGIIKKEQVINIIDSVVQRTTFTGEGTASVNIRGSVVQRTEIKGGEEKKKREVRKEREDQEHSKRKRSSEGTEGKRASKRNRQIAYAMIAVVVISLFVYWAIVLATSGVMQSKTVATTSIVTPAPITPVLKKTYNVAAMVSHPQSDKITVTYSGGPDSSFVTQIRISINGVPVPWGDGITGGSVIVGSSTSVYDGQSIDGSKVTVYADRINHVVAIARFMDGTEQVILDTQV